MNKANVDSGIEHKCQIPAFVITKKAPSNMLALATVMLRKMQLYKEQLHKKHVSFHKGIHPPVKKRCLHKIRKAIEKHDAI